MDRRKEETEEDRRQRGEDAKEIKKAKEKESRETHKVNDLNGCRGNTLSSRFHNVYPILDPCHLHKAVSLYLVARFPRTDG